MDIHGFKICVAEGVSESLECDYSDAEALCMLKESELDNMFARCQPVKFAVEFITKGA